MTGQSYGRKDSFSGGSGGDDDEARGRLGQHEDSLVSDVGKKCLKVDAFAAFSS